MSVADQQRGALVYSSSHQEEQRERLELLLLLLDGHLHSALSALSIFFRLSSIAISMDYACMRDICFAPGCTAGRSAEYGARYGVASDVCTESSDALLLKVLCAPVLL